MKREANKVYNNILSILGNGERMLVAKIGRAEFFLNSKLKKGMEIFTRNKKKAGKEFIYNGQVYFRKVDPAEISDIYRYEYLIYYPTGLMGVNWFSIGADDIMEDGKIKIRYHSGIIKGWNIQDRNICYMRVDPEEITKARLRRYYKRYKGVDNAFLDEIECSGVEIVAAIQKEDAL